ncbi:MAG: hypothetical protein NG740_00575 [Omnitrophica bacterium]|nr:hypothetical protein [Candidatus Omnitrophota bacterium]
MKKEKGISRKDIIELCRLLFDGRVSLDAKEFIITNIAESPVKEARAAIEKYRRCSKNGKL